MNPLPQPPTQNHLYTPPLCDSIIYSDKVSVPHETIVKLTGLVAPVGITQFFNDFQPVYNIDVANIGRPFMIKGEFYGIAENTERQWTYLGNGVRMQQVSFVSTRSPVQWP